MDWVFGVIAIGMLSFFGLTFRKRMKDWFAGDEDYNGPGFTLGDLRQLHASGKLSDAEFASAKAVLLQNIGASKK